FSHPPTNGEPSVRARNAEVHKGLSPCSSALSYRSPADRRPLEGPEPSSGTPRSVRGQLLVRAFPSRHPPPPVARRLFAGLTVVRLLSHRSSTRSFRTIDGFPTSFFLGAHKLVIKGLCRLSRRHVAKASIVDSLSRGKL